MSLLIGGNFNNSKVIVATLCLLVWSLRLAIFLLIRVLKAGEDKRFDGMRDKFFKFLGFWVFQMCWVYYVGLPVVLLNASGDQAEFGSSAGDIVGFLMFLIGFAIEVVSDQQKYHYRFVTLPAFKAQNPGKSAPVFQSGLWAYSRQPNYFGEILLWWGMFVMCLHRSTGKNLTSTAYVSIISPLFITGLLLFLSGIPLAEKGSQERYLSPKTDVETKKAYIEYRESVSPLIPMPKSWYKTLPLYVKRYALFEWPIYESDLLISYKKSEVSIAI